MTRKQTNEQKETKIHQLLRTINLILPIISLFKWLIIRMEDTLL